MPDRVRDAACRLVIAIYHSTLGPWSHTKRTQDEEFEALANLCSELTGDRGLREATFLLVPELRDQYNRYVDQTWKKGTVKPGWRDNQMPTIVDLPKYVQANFDMAPDITDPPSRNRLEDDQPQKRPETSSRPAQKKVGLFG